jgi:uncharacterized protein YndB with AHSA1/START domain
MTTEQLATIERTEEGGGLIHYKRQLAFPVEEVWSALTEPERLADWWPPFATDVTVDLREGGAITMAWPDGPPLEFKIVRVEAPTLLEHTHTHPGSWMRYELEPADYGTRLLATYFVTDPAMVIERGDVVGGHYSLDRLEQALEGHPVPWDNDAFAALQARYAERGLAAAAA